MAFKCLPVQVGASHPTPRPPASSSLLHCGHLCPPCPAAHLSVPGTNQPGGREALLTGSWASWSPGQCPMLSRVAIVTAQGEPGLGVTAVAHNAPPPPDLLRVRQEVAAAAAVRSPSGLEVHLPSSTASQRRKQGLAQLREGTAPAGAPSFSERYWGACIAEPPCSCACFWGTQLGWADGSPGSQLKSTAHTLSFTFTAAQRSAY